MKNIRNFVWNNFNTIGFLLTFLLTFFNFYLFYINGGFKFLSEGLIYLVLEYKLEIKCLLQLLILFPIILSIIALYLMMDIKIKIKGCC